LEQRGYGIKLVEIHRGHIRIEALGRTLTIGGEGFVRPSAQAAASSDYVDYVVYLNTLTHWDAPWAQEMLPSDVKSAFVAYLQDHFERRGLRLAIE